MPTEEFLQLRNDADLESETGPGGTLIFQDGDGFCVVGPAFTTTEESTDYAYGPTRAAALANYNSRPR